ncbi:MAG: ParB/RepB/Spo0J family partition protein [Coriobacteriales bacterium]|nr:ParB/RepB/Spo0J family partition protein [Coriobacteriales bacterium]
MAKRGGLGRGLGALLGETAGEVHDQYQDSAITELPLASIQPNPNQPRKRFDQEELQSLADSIRQNGLLQPIVVRPRSGGYQIVAGERRWQAAGIVGMERVPVVIREVSDDEVLQLALIENLQREDLDPLEEAAAYATLINQHHISQTELANVLCKSRSAISNTLRLLDLPQEVQDFVRDGKLSAGHARAILAVSGEEGRCALARKVVDEGLSVRQTEILGPLFSVKSQNVPAQRTPAPQSYKSAARRLRDSLSAKVSVKTVRGKHKIEIEFGDEQELDRLVERILGGTDERS